MPRERLTDREIELIILLLRSGAARTPVTLPTRERRLAAALWRRGIVYIWHRQSLQLKRPDGPFFSLTRDGVYRAEALLNARAARGLTEAIHANC